MEWDTELDGRCRAVIARLLALDTEETRLAVWFELVELTGAHLQAFARNSRVLWFAGLRDAQHATDLAARVTESMRRNGYANLARFLARYQAPRAARAAARSEPSAEEVDDGTDQPDDHNPWDRPEDREDLMLGALDEVDDDDDDAVEAPAETPFRGWTLRLTYYRARDHVRHMIRAARRAQKTASELPIQSTLRSRAASDARFEEFLHQYEEAVAQLKPLDRRVLALYGQGKKRNEIAEEVRRRPETVSNIRTRAIRLLRRRILAMHEEHER